MRVLFDVVHPAHVHFYRHLRAELEADGHQTLVVGRDKDVAVGLLRAYDIPHETVGRGGTKSMPSRALELVHRDLHLVRSCRRFRPDVVFTRNPAGVHAGRCCRSWTVYDTNDGRAAGWNFHLGAPLAHVVSSPSWLEEDYGSRHRRYRGPKELAYLHPNRFRPDPGIRTELGLGPDDPLAVVRFVAHDAIHDAHSVGFDDAARVDLVRRLQTDAEVVITSEEQLPAALEPLRYRLGPERIHHLLAAADVVVGDSGSMIAEAGVLGTPALRLSSWVGPIRGYLGRMEHDYGIVHCFTPDQDRAFEAALDGVLADLPAAKAAAEQGAARLVADSDDVTAWLRSLAEELVARGRPRWFER